MTVRVVQWSTGNVGKHALAGIAAHPELELVGVWVSTAEKVGRDAGELAGLAPLGVAATDDAEALLAARPDCVVYTAMADDRLTEALADFATILRAGVNVVASGPVFLQYPHGVVPDELLDPLRAAAAEGGASLFVNGIDPGFANDWLPLVLTSVSRRIDQVRCLEVLDYATYDNAKVLFDIMGFGRALDDIPLLLQPGVLSLAWGSVVRQLAAGLGVALDGRRGVRDPPAGTAPHRRCPQAWSRRARRPRCGSRCGAWRAGVRCACWSTSPGCTRISVPTGRGCPAKAATGSR